MPRPLETKQSPWEMGLNPAKVTVIDASPGVGDGVRVLLAVLYVEWHTEARWPV